MTNKKVLLLTILMLLGYNITAQLKLTQDTMQCPLVGFHFGTMFPSKQFSSDGGMQSLYKAPFLDFGVDGIYKFKSNWLVGIDGSFIFGSDNLKDREKRMSSLYSRDSVPIIIGTNGSDAVATCFNRAFSFRGNIGKILPVNSKNPNSGIVARLHGGFFMQKTVFMLNEVNAPQLDDDYAKLYDHKRRGVSLTESIGYWFMSNRYNLVNLYIAFEVSEYWTQSTRDYVIDDLMDIRGVDNTRYFDLTYSLKLCWMFPLKGKTAYDYYFY